MDVKDLIRGARLPEATVPLCLRADLVADYERTQRDLSAAQAAAGDSLAGSGGAAKALEDRLAALREEMVGSTLTVTLRALPSPRYQALMDEHPPRVVDDKMDRRDGVFGFNVDTFFTALARACTVAPELDAEDWAALLGDDGKLTDAQVEKLSTAAWKLNKKDVDLPF
ncbi:hypothetical protein [Micromonospora sp. DT47]|uniref:hypothetical protein n=1 Tax=Micromonospora sp. DT47 TaxID=3393431 RepID=UPI003CF6398F